MSAAAEPSEFVNQQGKASRLLLNVSPVHRSLSFRHWVIQLLATCFIVAGLVAAETVSPLVGWEQMRSWLYVFAVLIVVRISIALPLFLKPLEEVAASKVIKFLPLVSATTAAAFWVWTAVLFASPTLTVRELFMCVGFLSISISMTGMWSVTPVTSLIHYFVVWLSFSYSLYISGVTSIPILLLFNGSVAIVIWLNIFNSISQMEALRRANASLRVLENAATSKLATRSDFFAEASHDFKQRLHAAKLWVLSARDDAREGRASEQTMIRLGHEIDTLQAYMDTILDFARIESMDLGVPKLEPTSLQSIFQKLDLQYERIAEHDGRRLRLHRARGRVNTDPEMLLRMLENLVSNALRHTPKGVLVSARRVRGGVALEVWDQGGGIKPEAQRRIFEAFRQEDSGVRSGVGLGLAIVARFADRLGYTVELKSIAGRGTRFRILIPEEFVIYEN